MGQFKKHKFKSKDENYILEAVSGWLPIRYKQITQQHHLFDLAEDETETVTKNGKKKLRILYYFVFGHKEFSINQVMNFTYPLFFENEDEKLSYLYGTLPVDDKSGYGVELHPDGEAVRLFIERRIDYGKSA